MPRLHRVSMARAAGEEPASSPMHAPGAFSASTLAFTYNVTHNVTTPAPLQPPRPTLAATAQASPAVALAQRYLGVPYLWGGADPSGFDCSGLVTYVFAQLGIWLPRTAAQQFAACTPVALRALAPGDLVFFGSSPETIHHVSIYVGGGAVLEAPCSGALVRYDRLCGDIYGSGRPSQH